MKQDFLRKIFSSPKNQTRQGKQKQKQKQTKQKYSERKSIFP
jgi:hypothetical protein